jgi:hypothetical protein
MNDANTTPVITKVVPAAAVVTIMGSAGSASVAASAASASVVHNPYKKKFVGGAEKARLDAQKKNRGTKIMRPEEKERLDSEVLPKKMFPFERFFASLLRSSPQEFLEADTVEQKSEALWGVICNRVNLKTLKAPIPACVQDPQVHFDLRAALVLEEARNAISQPLASKWKHRKVPSGTMTLTAHYHEEKSNANSNLGHAKIVFVKQLPFTKDELFNIRPGGIFECLPRDKQRSIQNVILGVVGSSARETIEKSRSFTLFIFRDVPHKIEETDWIVAPITALITELRQFEAMTCKPSSIGFLHSLLGKKGPTHVRFGEDQKPAAVVKKVVKGASINDYFHPVQIDCDDEPSPMFKLPRLNPSQSKAASTFLESPQNSLTIIQGPPGTGTYKSRQDDGLIACLIEKSRWYCHFSHTILFLFVSYYITSGKTTLLVSVICRYITESGENHRRLMVCAPTNKAVSVLASRFVASINQDTCNCNAIMVGDADKLLVDERSTTLNQKGQSDKIQLSSMFVFSWMKTMMEEYRKIRNFFAPIRGILTREWTNDDLWKCSRRLEKRLTNSLPGLPKDVIKKATLVTAALEKLAGGGAAHGVVENLDKLLKALKEMPPDMIWRELMHSADVIFCTLASSGGLIFKNTAGMTDLIVDEAAAATEPELCIPIQLGPKRALFVGDPLQLPGTCFLPLSFS